MAWYWIVAIAMGGLLVGVLLMLWVVSAACKSTMRGMW